jgi:hypothetical protein
LQIWRKSQDTQSKRKGELSRYEGQRTPSKKELEIELIRLSAAFPSLSKGFLTILSERIVSRKMTCEQLHDAISRVIDTCKYPTPSVSEICSYDDTIKLYTHSEIVNEMIPKGYTFTDFDMIDIEGKKFWTLKK